MARRMLTNPILPSSPMVRIDEQDIGYLLHGAPFTLHFDFSGATAIWIHNPLPKNQRTLWPVWARGWHRCKPSGTWTGTANYYHPMLGIRVFSWRRFWKTAIFRFRLNIDFPNVRPLKVHSHLLEQDLRVNPVEMKPALPRDRPAPELSTHLLKSYRAASLDGLPSLHCRLIPLYLNNKFSQLKENQITYSGQALRDDFNRYSTSLQKNTTP